MAGRTMYVLPFSMGPVGSPMSQIGVQLTDSPYVVVNMRIMARIGLPVFAEIDKDEKRVVPCMHSVGAPLAPGQTGRAVAVQQGKVHRPLPGDARDLVLRLGLRRQRAARQEVLRAAHRLEHRARRRLDGRAHADPRRRGPAGREDLRRGGVPQRLRQDQLRHADPARRASRAGRSGPSATTSPGSSRTPTAACARSIRKPASSASRRARRCKTNPNAMATLAKNTIFTNVALTPEGGVWWEGMTDEPPAECLDWQGNRWTPEIAKETGAKAAHPNSRFTAPASQCPTIDPAWEDPEGVPISAIIFGGRRATTMPLVYQAFNWSAGVYIGRDHGLGDDGRRGRHGRQGAPRSRWRCCRSAAITWATISGTGSRCSARLTRDAAHLPRELVPQGRRRQVPVAGLQREHARAEVDRRPRARPRPGHGNADRLDAALRGHRVERAWTSRRRSSTSCRPSTATPGARK